MKEVQTCVGVLIGVSLTGFSLAILNSVSVSKYLLLELEISQGRVSSNFGVDLKL